MSAKRMDLDDFPFDDIAKLVDDRDAFVTALLNYFNVNDAPIVHIAQVQALTFSIRHPKPYEVANTLVVIVDSFDHIGVKTLAMSIGSDCSGTDGDHDDMVRISLY